MLFQGCTMYLAEKFCTLNFYAGIFAKTGRVGYRWRAYITDTRGNAVHR